MIPILRLPVVLAFRVGRFASCGFIVASAVAAEIPTFPGNATARVPAKPPVLVPAFVMKDEREQPKWRYIAHRDFEILTLAPTTVSESFADELAGAMETMDSIIPPAARLRLNPPLMLILDSQPAFDLSSGASVKASGNVTVQPIDSARAADLESSGLRLAAPVRIQTLSSGNPGADTYVHYMSSTGPNSSVLSPATLVAMGPVGGRNFYPQLLTKSNPRPAAWWGMGFQMAYSTLQTSNRTLRGASTNVRFAMADPSIRAADSAQADVRTWTPETQFRFVRWALFAEAGIYRERFWEFYRRSALEPNGGEPLFQSCFEFGSLEALKRMAEYQASKETISIPFSKKRGAPAPTKIRAATPGEIARITGEWARLAAQSSAVEKDRLLGAAGRIFDRGLKDSPSSDPKLLAAAGIYRAEIGRDAEARPLLDEATKAGVVRPQAYLELARIRLAAAKNEAGASGKISMERFASVRELLQQANAQSDQQEAYYELLVDLWENASGHPGRDELAPLAACAKVFTHRADLTSRSAQLHAALGYADQARALCRFALLFAKDLKTREELTLLNKSLTGPSRDSAREPAIP
jgi:hypothetical protein